jgi:hypothetical protein
MLNNIFHNLNEVSTFFVWLRLIMKRLQQCNSNLNAAMHLPISVRKLYDIPIEPCVCLLLDHLMVQKGCRTWIGYEISYAQQFCSNFLWFSHLSLFLRSTTTNLQKYTQKVWKYTHSYMKYKHNNTWNIQTLTWQIAR